MFFYHMCHIAQPQTIAFCIMSITSRHSEKFFKNLVFIFLRNSNTNIATEIRSAPNEEDPAFRLGTPVIRWSAVGTNAFGQVITNSLYLRDTFGVDAANDFIINFPYSSQPPESVPIPPATQQPDNFSVTRTAPTAYFSGMTNVPFTDKPHDFWTTNDNPTAVTVDYSAYGARIATTTTDPLQITNLRSGPGRIEIKASKNLDLRLTRIDGLNYLSLNSTNHFSGASGASVSATYCDIALGSTNGMLNTSGLLSQTLPRFSGTIDCYSAKWTDTVIFGGATNEVFFHVLYVDSDLSEFTTPQVFDLALRSTNTLIGDRFDVLDNLLLDTERLTVLSNGMLNISRADINWANSATRIKSFTNAGSIFIPSDAHFVSRNPDGSEEPYMDFVNSGVLGTYAARITSDNVENSGFIDSFFGPILIQANSNVVLHPFGFLWAPNSDISIATHDLYVTNQFVQAGHSLSFSITGSLNAGPNNWQVFDGFNLLSRPATGDFAETIITDTAFPFSEVMHSWAGEDRGPIAEGFTNNAALGALVLDGGLNSLFTFSGTGPGSNALYVDVLYLLNDATNRDAGGNLTALNLNPGMKLYFSQAFIDDGLGGLTDITSEIEGKNGGAIGQVSHTGPLSVLPRPGAKAANLNVDLKVSVGLSPTPHSVITWNTLANATNHLYCVDSPTGTDWQLINSFISPTNGAVTVTDPNLQNSRFYKVRVGLPEQ